MIDNHAEWQYLDILSNILRNGIKKEDRTGTGTLSVFGRSIRHDFRHGFPLLTSKKMFTKGIIHELLWFLKATEDAQYLIDNNVHIWDGWMKKTRCRNICCDTDFKDTLTGEPCLKCNGTGVDYYSLPHTYGIKWRNFDGVDQIANAIKQIKENPTSRRILVSAWDPRHVEDAALPWCHVLFQFNVRDEFLDISVYQRSADWFLGVPFNIASYSFLLYMFCEITGYKPGELYYTFGDAHLYLNHTMAAQQQLENFSHGLNNLCTLKFARKITDIDDFKYEDFVIENYRSWPAIKAEVSI